MNTRLQVELRLRKWSLVSIWSAKMLVAAGEKLAFSQDDISMKAIALIADQCEDWGVILLRHRAKLTCVAPSGRGVRVESHCYAGYVIPNYDSMVSKLIVLARS